MSIQLKKILLTFIQKRLALFIFLFVYFLLTFYTYKDYGSSFDEFMVYTRGDYFYHKVVGNDPYLQKGFVVRDSDNYVLHYYNSTYPALLYALNDSNSYDNYHLLNMIFSSFIFVGMYEILLITYNKWQYAILGPVFLFFMPRFLGHIPTNPKDIPFATVYILSLLAILLRRSFSPFLRVLVLGLLIGLTASLRFVGFSLVIVYFLYMFIESFHEKHIFRRQWENALETCVVGILTFTVFMASLPYIGADPFNHTIELMKVNTSYPWLGTIRLFGQSYSKDSFPPLYTLLWLFITTPISILCLSAFGIIASVSNKMNKLQLLLIISLSVQIIFYIVLKPFVYNGLRHYLFLLPQFALFAVIALISFKEHVRLNMLIVVLLCIEAGIILITYFKLHPYEYTYFNPIVKMSYDVTRDFDFDYWATSDRKSLEWLKSHQNKKNPKIFLCSTSPSLQIYYPEAINVTDNILRAEYIVCNDNTMLDTIKGEIKYKTIYQIQKDGYIFNTILEVL
ncbi:MAG: hypothetical protein Q8P72_06820 [Candidatus Roizmanbacteria bacterium]|nr:hypothetical protein [Candidatus Roizmanbacteria bacterium]